MSKSTPSERAIEEKIPWHFLIPFMVVLGIFVASINPLTSYVGTWKHGPGLYIASLGDVTVCYSALTVLPFVSLYFAGALGRLSFFRKRVNLKTMTWLYVTTLCLSYYLGRPSLEAPCCSYLVYIGNRILDPGRTYDLIPWFMAPPIDVAKQILYGGPVPWADLMPMIVFWSAYGVIYGLLALSVATLFRKNWIDIERVPFPHALAAYELLIRTVPERKAKFKGPFLIGLILGIVVWIPVIFIELFPWFPDIYGYRTNMCSFGSYIVQPGEPIATLVVARIGKEPLGVAIAYFAPLHVLFNTWFWWLVLVILSQVAYIMGYYTGILDLPGCGRATCGGNSILYGEPFKWMAVFVGGMWGLAISLFILSGKYIIDTLRVAFGRVNSSTKAEFEKDEPISYRATYLLLIGTIIGTIVINLICGLSPLSAILPFITLIGIWFANMRLIGLAGVYTRGEQSGYALPRLLLYPNAPETPTRDFVLSAKFNAWFTDAPHTCNAAGGNFLTSFLAYRMASLTGISSKSIFKVVVASIIIYTIVTIPTYLAVAYTFGVTKLMDTWGIIGCNSLIERDATPGRWNVCPGTEPWISQFTAGLIFVVLLNWLHARFIWFPFEPIGFILGIGAGFEWGFWSYALVAWVLKMITLRIGGSKLYEEFGMPIAGGYIAGHMLALIPGIILSRIRFFFPF